MWGRLKGQVLRSKDEQDVSDDDTIVSRALFRHYGPNAPAWLAAPGSIVQHQVYESSTPSPPPQTYSRDSGDRPRMFERSDSFAMPSTTPSRSKTSSSSGLASRLKNSQW